MNDAAEKLNELSIPSANQMQEVLRGQQQAFNAETPVGHETRIDRIDRLIAALLRYDHRISEAILDDFGSRHKDLTRLFDTSSSIAALKYARKHLRRWMKPVKGRPIFPLGLLGARSELRYQPKGVVGIISPWNFPMGLAMMPLAGVLAAGNRAMIKPSELSPATASIMAEMITSAFDATEICVFEGGADVARAFSALPFDHLVFTGATSIGREVMRSAAEHLVPVTLELGGKSPVILGRDVDIDKVCDRVLIGKLTNSGQICLAPDYLLVHESQLESVLASLQTIATAMYPRVVENPDYAAIINARHFARLRGLLDEASERGTRVVEVNPGNDPADRQAETRQLPLSILVEPDDELKVMQDEIFGPILPVKSYQNLDDAIDYINARPRPLGLYYFGNDKNEQEQVLGRTISGGVTVNDVIHHVAQEDLPFGGIGPSGMGAYHGAHGFQEFSHARTVYRQSRLDIAGLIGTRPPYGDKLSKTVKRELGS